MKKSQEIVNEKIQKVSEKDIIGFVQTRFDEVKKSKKVKELVEFQAMNKYMIMCHDQNELKNLGNIVASNKKVELSEILR